MSPRKAGAAFVCVSVILVQLYFVVGAYENPHHIFGYQPFSEASS